MTNIEQLSRAVFDEMRQIIGQNRISREAFLSAIACGLHTAVEKERERCAAEARWVAEEHLGDTIGQKVAFEIEGRIRARSSDGETK